MNRWLVSAVLALACGSASALSFVDGNRWNRMSNADKQSYIAGAVDMRVLTSRFMDIDPITEDCIRDIGKMSQLLAIVEAEHQADPALWHTPMIGFVVRALAKTCKRLGLDKR